MDLKKLNFVYFHDALVPLKCIKDKLTLKQINSDSGIVSTTSIQERTTSIFPKVFDSAFPSSLAKTFINILMNNINIQKRYFNNFNDPGST